MNATNSTLLSPYLYIFALFLYIFSIFPSGDIMSIFLLPLKLLIKDRKEEKGKKVN